MIQGLELVYYVRDQYNGEDHRTMQIGPWKYFKECNKNKTQFHEGLGDTVSSSREPGEEFVQTLKNR